MNAANNGGASSSNLSLAQAGGTSASSGGPYPLDPQFLTPLYSFWTGDGSEEDEEDDLESGGVTSCPTCAPRSGSSSSEATSSTSSGGGTVLVCRECGGNDVHALPGTRAQAYLARASRAFSASGGFGFGSRWFSGFGFGFGFGAGNSGTAAAAATASGGGGGRASTRRNRVSEEHKDLVRSVALGEKFVVSGSYDRTIKVWDRRTGALVADLTGGHVGRIFCIAFDRTKVVSCGEDHRVCIWDFAHGIDTSFIQLS